VLDINDICAVLESQCLHLHGMHTFGGGSDMTLYSYAKGKVSALNTLITGDFLG